MLKTQCRKMSNSKALVKDDGLRYWLKNLTPLHPHIAVQLNHTLDEGKILTIFDDFRKDSNVPKRPVKAKCV